MKWRHWAILIILVLLNYIIFSTAFTQLAARQQPSALALRTPKPTFQAMDVESPNWTQPSKWIVLPTCTAVPTRTPVSPTPTPELAPTDVPTGALTATEPLTEVTIMPEPTLAPVMHTVQQGESLSIIAQKYGVAVEALAQANGLSENSVLQIDQRLIIPGASEAVATSTPIPPTSTPAPKPKAPTPKPPTITPTPKPQFQFTGQVVWDPLVAPNCIGPNIAKQSVVVDLAGNPVNGVVIEVDCYGNVWRSHPSGTPGEYEPGHYDFAFGQSSPQNWTCTARVVEVNGQPVQASASVSITFDTNRCKPGGDGHQAAIVNWTKHW